MPRKRRVVKTAEESVQAKFIRLMSEVNGLFVDREEEVEIGAVALVSRSHVCFIGEPGEAKSAVIQQLCKRISDLSYFRKLVFADTPDTDLLGMYSLAALELSDEYKRKTGGFLPTADVAFIDEIFRASSSVLPALHDIIHEREFRNGPYDERCPLISLFSATNTFPKDTELQALWDRFMFRKKVTPLDSRVKVEAMLKLPFQTTESIKPVITLKEVKTAIGEASEVTVPEPVLQLYLDILTNLRGMDPAIEISDRRAHNSLSILKATAWLRGRAQVDKTDLAVLKHVLWTREDEMAVVHDALSDYAESVEHSVEIMLASLREAMAALETKYAQNEASTDEILNVVDKTRVAMGTLNALERRASTAEEKAAIDRAIEEAEKYESRLGNMAEGRKSKDVGSI